jgi:DNA helicase-4
VRHQPSFFTQFTLSLLARTFAKYRRYHQINIDDNGFILVSKLGTQTRVSFLDLGKNITVSDGLFWSTVSFELVHQSPLKLGGIKKALTDQLLSTVQQKSYLVQKSYFSNLHPTIEHAYKTLTQLINQHTYIRRHDIEDWFNHYEELKPALLHPNITAFYDLHTQDVIAALKQVFDHGPDYFDDFNAEYIRQQLIQYKSFFDSVESQPLTQAQREACVKNERANLVLAGAGTGKTSTMIGRAGYLIKSGLAKPSQVLMLAFGNDAANEMADRLQSKLNHEGFTVKTFHSLGMHIITHVEGKPPVINKMATDERLKMAFIDQQLMHLMDEKQYRDSLIHYFSDFNHSHINPYDFDSLNAYNQAIKNGQLRTLQGELVKSTEACDIANFLFKQGVHYEYEAKYPFNTEHAEFKAYQPDFYLPDYEIYVEHFAIDEQGKTPSFINQTSYAKGMQWKRTLHKHHSTLLIETYSYQKRRGILLKELASSLKKQGVVFQPLDDNDLFTKLKELGSITKLTQLICQLMSRLKSSQIKLDNTIKSSRNTSDLTRLNIAQPLFNPIIDAYESALKDSHSIDFDDLILKSIKYLKLGHYKNNFTHILVDEFQDISPSRAELLLALRQSGDDNTVFCVGDDWQSIYQFAGSHVEITQQFNQYFGHTAFSVLDTTFRFNNKIGDVATSFILKNPDQITKHINSITHTHDPAITLIKSSDSVVAIREALTAISDHVTSHCSVLILVRFNHDKPQLPPLKSAFPKLTITTMSVHASKGKEADFVIVLGLNKGEFGFPPEKSLHPLLALFNPTEQAIAFAEERRVFYVALTRAKHHVYLVTNAEKTSSFVRELELEDYDITHHVSTHSAIQDGIPKQMCPECELGYLNVKQSHSRHYLQCNEAPLCYYTQSLCKLCQSALQRQGQFNLCINPQCNYREPICPVCGGILMKREGQYGAFWGCNNYRSNKATSCSYKVKSLDLTPSN